MRGSKERGDRKTRIVKRRVYPAMTPENDALVEEKHDEIMEVKDLTENAKDGLQRLGLPQEVIDEIEDGFLELEQQIENLADCTEYGYPRTVRVRRTRK